MSMDLTELAGALEGPLLTPADPDFASELSGSNLSYVHTPELVVGAASVGDVQLAVRFAAEHGMHVTVRATGHGDHATITHGMVITLKRLDAVEIDPVGRIATIDGGARWAAVVAAAGVHGLAPIAGSSTNVGAAGYLLGGGLGPLARSHGFSSDYVREFTVVTADGEVMRASRDEHPDLFWSLRGGKGGFGVVVQSRVQLIDLATLYGGSLVFAEDDIETVLRGWIDWTHTAPDSVTTSVAIMHFPPIEQVPEPMRGRTLLMLRFAFPGDAAEGVTLAAPLRALATPFMDTLDELPASAIATIHNDPTEPGLGWASGLMLRDLDQGFASAVLATVGTGVDTPFLATEIRHIGGATRHDVEGGSAVGGRSAGYLMNVVGMPNPALFETVLPDAFGAFLDAIAPWVSADMNVNFRVWHTPEEFRSLWPAESFTRLDVVRSEVDPSGTFAYGPTR
ncbi:FAD-binding protein [Leifsonia sp. H3M29-4]|uniref:FAD-binding oxidoreductase n=1 Tax=Salinibacterium metalliresistens TaxID=3031321 RepID=UPI0023DBA08B|nr:FAD-binding protein [Salinibacterium metalliresistens]MDF1477832.1 FAD-binding protein [Salinibacterium metalliresistens]